MPDRPGGSGSGRLEWESDWSTGDVPTPPHEPEDEDEDTTSEPPRDTPELVFQPVHAALPGTIGSLAVVRDEAVDYAEAWLSDAEMKALGDLSGLRVLNAMAGTGEDAIALARMGPRSSPPT